MSSTANGPIGDVGKYLPPALFASSALRPQALDELKVWGGPSLVRGKRVLDLGCGDGRFAIGVAGVADAVDGLDPDPDAIAAARKRARDARIDNATFAIGAAQSLPYPDGAFNVVISSWTL